MRDPARIDRITEKLNRHWHNYPDQRLGQLVSNLQGLGPQDVFHKEDDDWEERLDEVIQSEPPTSVPIRGPAESSE